MRLLVILTTVSAVIAIPLPVRLRKRCGYGAGAVYPRGTFESGTGTDATTLTTGYSTPLNLFGGGTPVTQPPSSDYNPNDNFCAFPSPPDTSSGNGGGDPKKKFNDPAYVIEKVTSGVKKYLNLGVEFYKATPGGQVANWELNNLPPLIVPLLGSPVPNTGS